MGWRCLACGPTLQRKRSARSWCSTRITSSCLLSAPSRCIKGWVLTVSVRLSRFGAPSWRFGARGSGFGVRGSGFGVRGSGIENRESRFEMGLLSAPPRCVEKGGIGCRQARHWFTEAAALGVCLSVCLWLSSYLSVCLCLHTCSICSLCTSLCSLCAYSCTI